MTFKRLLHVALIASLIAPLARADDAVDPAVLARIRDAAMTSDWAYQRLADLSDTVGPRLAGSPGAEAGVALMAKALESAGLRVTLQPMKAPHWVRGEERGEIVAYGGQPKGITQRVILTALGGSGATPPEGLTAPVVILHDFDEIDARAADVKGRIVLLDVPFDQNLADNGFATEAYGYAGRPRFKGPAALGELGAAAVLVRSVGGANYRVTHTGATDVPKGKPAIPSAAVTAEDAMLMERLSARGPMTMKLVLTPRTLPRVDSHNVIGDLPGREKPDEIVLVSGHLDSWDLGTGAMDDGLGVTAAMGAVALLKQLGLTPRRTVRAVGWMDEESGGSGADAYFESVKDKTATHVAAIESDFGLGRPLGIRGTLDAAAAKTMKPVTDALQPIGAGVLSRREGHVGADVAKLQDAGVIGFSPLIDGRRYFDLHHTPADTFDKIDPDAMKRLVATLAVLTYYLAERPEPVRNGLQP